MENNNEDYFWPSYVDLLTSIFFIMLILFVVTFFLLTKEKRVMQEKLQFLEDVEKTLEGLSKDTTVFKYEERYKRYKLVQEVEFNSNESEIQPNSIRNYETTTKQLRSTGRYLKSILDTLQNKRQKDARYKDISYLMIITGMASREGRIDHNYHLSYNRAYALYNFWKDGIVDFDEEYRDFIDLQISGVGTGGTGRDLNDQKNRSFFIQIIPKYNSINTDK